MFVPKTSRRSTALNSTQFNNWDVEVNQFQQYTNMFEPQYPFWWSKRLVIDCFRGLIENTFWNCYICYIVLQSMVLATINVDILWLHVVSNLSYTIHVLAIGYTSYVNRETNQVTWWTVLGLSVDVFTFTHYIVPIEGYIFACYCIRLHRPFYYLYDYVNVTGKIKYKKMSLSNKLTLTNYNLNGSVLGTTLKYWYIIIVVRIVWAIIWCMMDAVERTYVPPTRLPRQIRTMDRMEEMMMEDWSRNSPSQFLSALYIVNKMFIPIGPSVVPENDVERVTCMLVMMTGCFLVSGAAVASMSLIISLYMRPEETFRARHRLIIKQMKEGHVPPSQRDKVETFYKMYWHKQKAVSTTQLLPTFPPNLCATVHCAIYFEATQKSRILRDLSFEFLSELAKKMKTKRFIPGDALIKRSSNKSATIYIAYGDVEMVTAEDDATAILRMSRGTILTACGACAPAGFGRAHVQVRAATFCIAHVLEAKDLWKVAVRFGKDTEQSDIMNDAFVTHMDMVRRHYYNKERENVKHKSSILHFKRCLMALKEARDAKNELLLAKTDVFLEIAGCYIMRNRADSSLTDESDAICLRPTFPCILQPTSSLQNAWNFFVAIIIVVVCFVHPYYIVYRKTVPIDFRFFDYFVTGIYTLDIFVYLSTGVNIEEGVPITLAQTSSQQMRSHWFVLDVLATLPIFEFIGAGHFAGINKLLRLPKVFRVLKSVEDMCVYHSNVLRFLSYTLMLIIACYLMAALQQGFMCFHFGYCQVTNFTHSPYWEKKPLDDKTVQHRVTFGLYWAISMIMFTTHMETWGTSNWSNLLYTMFVLEVCVVMRIFMEAVYSATIMVTTSLREDYDATISMVKSCFIKNEVDPVLRQRFITYLQLCWYTDKAYMMVNKRSIFYDLPSHVYQDIVARQRVKYLLAIPFMKFLNQEDLKDVSSNAKLFYTSPNEIILNTGDITNEMYVITQGVVERISPETKQQIGLLNERCHFGDFPCLFRVPSFCTFRAVTHVQLFSISLKSLTESLKHPYLREIMDDIKSQPEFQSLSVPLNPCVFYVPPVAVPNTERFSLPRKYEVDFAFLQPFYKLGFLSVLRYIFPRFTIRPDSQYLIRYEWFRCTCALASAMVFPGYTYLRIEWPALLYIAWFLDITAYVDMVQRMLIGYYTEQGILVYHPASTAAHYVRGAFIVDLFGCLPWESLQGSRKYGDKFKVTRTEQMLMLGRLLQLYRLQSIRLVLDNYFERKDLLMIIRCIPLFTVMVNVLTCNIVLNSAKIYFSSNYTSIEIVPLPDHGGSWLKLFSDQFRFSMTNSLWNLHLGTYFWVVYETTTTGYNCFNPSNFQIMRQLYIGMLTGAMIITYFSVRIISIRANVNKPLAEFQEHMKDMIIWMKKEKLDADLQREVFQYYEYSWDQMRGVEYNSVFKLCDQMTLRTDAILHVYGRTFAKCPILSLADVSILRMVGRACHSIHFLRGMYVIARDDVTSDIYIVHDGSIQARHTRGDISYVEALQTGSIFGNMEDEETIRCPISFVATNRVHLLRINTKTFYKIINQFPDVQDLMKKYKEESNAPYYIKGGGTNEGHKYYKDGRFSTTYEVRRRRNLAKYIYFKDEVFQTYLILVSLLCIYLDVYNAGFQNNSVGLMISLYVLDVAFYLKMVVYMWIPASSSLTEQARKILRHRRKLYLSSDFKYDVISCIPLELFCVFNLDHQGMLFSRLRLNRFFRIVTVYSCLKRYREQFTVNLSLVTIWAVTIWFTLSVHTLSCIWYWIGNVNDKNQPGSSWIHKDAKTTWCHNTYICSLYFVLTTFTQNGVGDIMPKMQSEVLFVCVLQILSTMVYMIYVGEFSNVIQYKSFRSFSFYSKCLELQEFLKNNRVSRNLAAQVNRYSLHLWRDSRGLQSPHFLRTAPLALRLTIMSDAYMKHIETHFIFKECEPAFLRQLVGCLQLYTYNENMFVVKACEITNSMYFIHRGKVTDLSEELDFKSQVYTVGNSFGVTQGLKYNVPFKESFRTLTKSQVLSLRLEDWLSLLQHFPVSAATIATHEQDVGGDGGGHGGAHPGAIHHGSRMDSRTEIRMDSEDRLQYWRRFKPRVTELIDRGTQPSPPATPPGAANSATGPATGSVTGATTGSATSSATGSATSSATGSATSSATGTATGPATDSVTGLAAGPETGSATGTSGTKTEPLMPPLEPSSRQMLPSIDLNEYWPTDSRRRDTTIRNRPYIVDEDENQEIELTETNLDQPSEPLPSTSRPNLTAVGAPPTSDDTSSSSSSNASKRRTMSRFLKRVVSTAKKFIPRQSVGDIKFNNETETASLQLNVENLDEDDVAELEREMGRLSQSTPMPSQYESLTVTTHEAVAVATAPDDAEAHAESAKPKPSISARLKHKSVRVRYEDDVENMEGSDLPSGDNDESQITSVEVEEKDHNEANEPSTSKKDNRDSSGSTSKKEK